MNQTFSQFKHDFYRRVPDLAVFDCEECNLVKVVLDGLVVNYVDRGIIDEHLFANKTLAWAILFAKRLKHRRGIHHAKQTLLSLSSKLKASVLLYDNARVTENQNGEVVSFYFNKISQLLGKQNCLTIYQKKTQLVDGPEIGNLQLATLFESYTAKDKDLALSLKKTYLKIKSLGVFTAKELQNIRIAFSKFFDDYRLWRFILDGSKIKVAMFDQHYHREGMILAMKRKNIKVLELQHGLIAEEDIFYVFPKAIRSIASRALFPDKIFTYGKYWSEILLKGHEFTPSQIDVLGLYQEVSTHVSSKDKETISQYLRGQEFLLITTQTYMHEDFVDYVEWLSKDLIDRRSQIKIVIKNHPSEKLKDYQALEKLHNVMLTEMNTEFLLSTCKWHVSCYSTTLYDAKKYACENFSLWIDKWADYVNAFLKQGISLKVTNRQNPVFLPIEKTVKSGLDTSLLFENYDTHKFKLMGLVAPERQKQIIE